MLTNPKVLVIIPAFNESASIERVVNKLTCAYPQYDYVIINDGSTDGTAQICKNNKYNIIDLPVNLGLARGFQAGMKYADLHGYDYALQFDGDGQHNPKYIADMVREISAKDLDFVIASRFVSKKGRKSLRALGGGLIRLTLGVTTGKTVKDPTSGMRMFNKKLIKILARSFDFGPEPDTIACLIRFGAKFSEVQAEMNDRTAGESYLNITRSVRYMAEILISIIVTQWFRKKIEL